MCKTYRLSMQNSTMLAIVAVSIVITLLWPKLSCIPSKETLSTISALNADFDRGCAQKSDPNHHASCIAHVAAPNRDLQVTSLESKLLNFLRLQSEEIGRYYIVIPCNTVHMLELEKPILALDDKIKFFTSMLAIRSTVLLI